MTVYGYVNLNIERIKHEVTLGLMPVSVLRHWEIYSRFDAHKKMNRNMTDAVTLTSADMRCCESTIYKVIKKMEQPV